jgi:hypothetical protein
MRRPLFAQATGAGMQFRYGWLVLVIATLILGGCLFKDQNAVTDPVVNEPNGKPTISGVPPIFIRVGEAYDFRPSASDPDGDTLSFSIANKPGWANFNAANGRLTGTPRDGDVGMTADVRITVSDGMDQAALDRFSISVNQISLGSATLSWMPPTQNADGTVLADLSGYKVYYGRSAGALDQIVTLDNPGLSSYVIENLSPATWYFAMTSYNSQGLESNRSATASKTVG